MLQHAWVWTDEVYLQFNTLTTTLRLCLGTLTRHLTISTCLGMSPAMYQNSCRIVPPCYNSPYSYITKKDPEMIERWRQSANHGTIYLHYRAGSRNAWWTIECFIKHVNAIANHFPEGNTFFPIWNTLSIPAMVLRHQTLRPGAPWEHGSMEELVERDEYAF